MFVKLRSYKTELQKGKEALIEKRCHACGFFQQVGVKYIQREDLFQKIKERNRGISPRL
jgi:hypothetical protein